MVIYRSKLSRSRTSIHGGLRRGAAAAAVGAVLVLSAGVPASQAADGSTDPTRVAVDGDLTGVNGLLNGILGTSGGQPTAPTQPAPAPTGSTAPTATGTPTPAPASTATTQSTPAPSATTAPQGTTPQSTTPQGTVPPSSAPAPAGTSPAPGAAAPAGAQPNGQPVDPAAPATQDGGQTVEPAADQATQDAHDPNATPVSAPRRPGDAPASRETMASATEADAGAEPAKVWLGVGLVGSAGAAGLVFARIRRI